MGEAIISDISRKFNVNVNIVLASVEMLQESQLGSMIAVLSGEEDKTSAAISYLEKCNVRLEVIDNDGNS